MKKLIILLTLITLLLSLSSCGYTIGERTEKERWEREGTQKAADHIESKYGEKLENVKAEAIKEEMSLLPELSPSYTTRIKITGEINGDPCTVITDVETPETECYDNFQKNEIEKDLKTLLYETYNEKPKKLKITYTDIWIAGESGFINERYDGNIAKFIKDEVTSIEIDACYEELKSINKITESILSTNTEINITSFKKNTERTIIENYDSTDLVSILNNLPYIKEFYLTDAIDEFSGYHKLDMKKFDDFLYCNRAEKTPSINFEILEARSLEGIAGQEIVSKIYTSPPESVEIYFPLSSIKNYSVDENYCICIIHTKGGSLEHTEITPRTDMNYLSFNHRYDNGYWFIAKEDFDVDLVQ